VRPADRLAATPRSLAFQGPDATKLPKALDAAGEEDGEPSDPEGSDGRQAI